MSSMPPDLVSTSKVTVNNSQVTQWTSYGSKNISKKEMSELYKSDRCNYDMCYCMHKLNPAISKAIVGIDDHRNKEN